MHLPPQPRQSLPLPPPIDPSGAARAPKPAPTDKLQRLKELLAVEREKVLHEASVAVTESFGRSKEVRAEAFGDVLAWITEMGANMNESTETNHIWHSGPPPHIGWWNASVGRAAFFWDGKCWSFAASRDQSQRAAAELAALPSKLHLAIEWNGYCPENARVPRINPDTL